MKNQAKELMRKREVMIADAMEVLTILGVDMNLKTVEVEKIVEVEKEVVVEKEVIKEVEVVKEVEVTKEVVVENLERIKELEAEVERLNAIIEKKDKALKILKARQSIAPLMEQVESVEKIKEEVKQELVAGDIEIRCQDEHAIHGYYLRQEGDRVKKTPFTCGKKTSTPIVYGKGMMNLSKEVGEVLVNKGLVKKHSVNIDINTMTVSHKGKDIEMLVYRDKTGALVGALEQRCAFVKHKNCTLPLVTKMSVFIDNGCHQIVEDDGTKSPIIGYEKLDSHKAYVHTIAAALAKYEALEKEKISKLEEKAEEGPSADDMFSEEFDTEVTSKKEVDQAVLDYEAEYMAKARAMFGR